MHYVLLYRSGMIEIILLLLQEGTNQKCKNVLWSPHFQSAKVFLESISSLL